MVGRKEGGTNASTAKRRRRRTGNDRRARLARAAAVHGSREAAVLLALPGAPPDRRNAAASEPLVERLGDLRKRGCSLLVVQVEVALCLDHELRGDVVLEELRVLEEELDVRLRRREHEE